MPNNRISISQTFALCLADLDSDFWQHGADRIIAKRRQIQPHIGALNGFCLELNPTYDLLQSVSTVRPYIVVPSNRGMPQRRERQKVVNRARTSEDVVGWTTHRHLCPWNRMDFHNSFYAMLTCITFLTLLECQLTIQRRCTVSLRQFQAFP
jgi:hypothetical protein